MMKFFRPNLRVVGLAPWIRPCLASTNIDLESIIASTSVPSEDVNVTTSNTWLAEPTVSPCALTLQIGS